MDTAPKTLSPGRSRAMRAWVLVVLAVAVATVILGWHAHGGTPDPTDPATHMSRTSAVVNSAVLVFREGLETILVLAAIMASFLGGNRAYRRPVAIGGGVAIAASVATWFVAVWAIGMFGDGGLAVQAATGIPAILVLLLVMNWFFHRVYWTGWIAHHHGRRRKLLAKGGSGVTAGLVLLGFTAVYREGFEIVLFLQNLRIKYGATVVLEGVAIGLALTALVGALTFLAHRKLPYKKMLVLTGALIGFVLVVMVGESMQELQLAGWIPTTTLGFTLPGWMGTWLAIFPTVETLAAQTLAAGAVIGSYLLAEQIRVKRPQRRGEEPARRAEQPPAASAEPLAGVG